MLIINGYPITITKFKYNKCIGSINKPKWSIRAKTEFKYNKCIGSM